MPRFDEEKHKVALEELRPILSDYDEFAKLMKLEETIREEASQPTIDVDFVVASTTDDDMPDWDVLLDDEEKVWCSR